MRKVTSGMMLRAGVDLFLMNLCLLGGFAIGAVWKLLVTPVDLAETISNFLAGIHLSPWPFLLVSILTLSLFSTYGFYTKGRFYQGRYKAVAVIQAIAMVYLVAALVGFLLQAHFPRAVLISGWLVSSVVLVGSRVWTKLWRKLVILTEHTDGSLQLLDERRVLVIGGARYIGSALLPKLLEKGYKVRLLDLFVYGEEPIAAYRTHPNLEIIKADFRQVDEVAVLEPDPRDRRRDLGDAAATDDHVEAGETVAELIDPAAEDPAEARTPLASRTSGVMFGRHLMKMARPGEKICKIAGPEPLPGREGVGLLTD